MSTDVLLLAMAGLVAALAGGATVLLAPGRTAPLLAGGALVLLGVIQIGFARVALGAPWGGDALWFRHTLTLTLPTTTLWVLLSIVLGRRGGEPLSPKWRAYLGVQTLLALAALAWSTLAPEPPEPRAGVILLGTTARVLLALVLLNVVLFTVNFEATYLSFPRRFRRAFRPALGGIVLCARFYAALSASGIVVGRASISALAFGTAPVAILALAMPISFVRRRLGMARLAPHQQPVTATTSYLLAGGFMGASAAMFWLNQAMGIGTVRGLWSLATACVILGVTALAISNRARRRAERLFAPIMSEWRGPLRRAVRDRLRKIEGAATVEELARRIPESARELAGVDEVTLLLLHAQSASFRVVASTVEPPPAAVVKLHDPLAVELRRARRPIRLDGRADDLEYVSIYIENRDAILNCGARIAVPLLGEEVLIGLLLAGAPSRKSGSPARVLSLLNLAGRRYAYLIEKLAAKHASAQEKL
jgi:hypothetical protein